MVRPSTSQRGAAEQRRMNAARYLHSASGSANLWQRAARVCVRGRCYEVGEARQVLGALAQVVCCGLRSRIKYSKARIMIIMIGQKEAASVVLTSSTSSRLPPPPARPSRRSAAASVPVTCVSYYKTRCVAALSRLPSLHHVQQRLLRRRSAAILPSPRYVFLVVAHARDELV